MSNFAKHILLLQNNHIFDMILLNNFLRFNLFIKNLTKNVIYDNLSVNNNHFAEGFLR